MATGEPDQITVAELIEQLNGMPQDEKVYCSANMEYSELPVSGVYRNRDDHVTICAD